ncbi:MAG: DUF2935 domain-containing protein [Clostridia bacterium]|nr:DUF2935 domain-containing protein [Clostridia bacterium]
MNTNNSTGNYIGASIDLHLFFGRIMKEHSLFLRAGFTPANGDFAKRAAFFQDEFEKLLDQAVELTGGTVSQRVLDSGEIVTEFTLTAEKQTEKFTGIPIDKEITERELRLNGNGRNNEAGAQLWRQVRQLNRRALELVNGLISFKERILSNVLGCRMFTMNYPLLIEHIIREAKLYRDYIMMLERQGYVSEESMRDVECFWNRIMMEHSMFIRGLLDPSEGELIDTADGFAEDFAELLESCRSAQDRTMTAESLEKTLMIRDFKTAGVRGIENCSIRSVILPLLADHVLREANHYIRLLEE